MAIKVTDVSHARAITHAGVFHADDVLAAAILHMAFGDLPLARVSALPRGLPEDIVVFDIGGGVYDHHQAGGNGARENGVPYASAGLIWRKYGPLVVLCPESQAVCERVDEALIQGVDAVDNGFGLESHSVSQMTFSRMVSMFNPLGTQDAGAFDRAFERAAEFAQGTLERLISYNIAEFEAHRAIECAIDASDHHILLLQEYRPWKNALLESANPKADEIMLVVYPSLRGGFNWQCVPKGSESSDLRILPPRAWWGLQGESLSRISGVPDALFCHKNGFLGCATSREGAVQMAMRIIEESHPGSLNG